MSGNKTYHIILSLLTFLAVIAGILLHVFRVFDTADAAEIIDDTDLRTGAFSSVDMDLYTSDVLITAGEDYSIEVTPKGRVHKKSAPRCFVQDDTLTVRQSSERKWGIFSLGTRDDAYRIRVTVPKDADTLKKISIDTGTGEAALSDVTADLLQVDSGTGGIRVEECSFDTIRLDSGTGKVQLALTEQAAEIRIDNGTGDVSLKLPAKDRNSNFNLDSGLGTITIDGKKHNLLYKTDCADGNYDIRVDTGTGDIEVAFEK